MSSRTVLIRTAVSATMLATAAGTALGLPGPAVADPCPDVAVIFARGTGESPGLGKVGQAFVDALAPHLGDRTLDTYAVNYPASFDFLTTAEGATDAGAQLAAVVSRCKNTEVVLGGYSQGSATVDMLAGVPPLGDTVGEIGSAPSLATPFAEKVSAAVVFGNPATRFGTPLSTTGLFAGKAIDLCDVEDPICSPTGDTMTAHEVYEFTPYPQQAADFVAGILDH